MQIKVKDTKTHEEKMVPASLLKKAFEDARCFNSIDGIVDIDVVLNMPTHDVSDLTPVYSNYSEWFEQNVK